MAPSQADSVLMPPPAPRAPRESASPDTPTATASPTRFRPFSVESGPIRSNWESYFAECRSVNVGDRGAFRVYFSGDADAKPVLFCLHGAGYTGLTWACMTHHIPLDKYRLVAMDMRGHGGTRTLDDTDFSVATLGDDVEGVAAALFGLDASARPPIVLVGHSMGGAIAANVAACGKLGGLVAVVVVDVVEGTAMESLPHMKMVLEQRPKAFQSEDLAVAWALNTGMTHNTEAADISIPSQLVVLPPPFPGVTWRTKLEDTSPYWEEWFNGLSEKFLSAPVPKLLILAGTDRLDTPLNIAQMQGKFQLALIPAAGHAIQEDEPVKAADAILKFLKCFRIGNTEAAGIAAWLPPR
mmetsp:Transcript_33458/g.64085  ORF Transcript_33458/g.64085 Transcript_33458/m.64085 type:complete len:354 (+) Transcript_33458:480-1541(+)|eukprot:CAMPEP_0114276692 /NCGR_PEP_ID=MMETSP0059-20121206/369_1 /TAXON_ID=36894 /ORGANISM="Pyramimonas parkeae, Strain CCMP726" /LENGTH=353 /DNA_ID=CAMNT_0001396701 /DNA_START=458 /DNA_END=1519 /DNA_ORIENTATION=-